MVVKMRTFKKLITLLLLVFSFHMLKANAKEPQEDSLTTITLSKLGVETNPNSGQLILRDLDTRRRIFVGNNFSREQLLAIYHKYSLGRSLNQLGLGENAQIQFEINEEALKNPTHPHLGFKIKTNGIRPHQVALPTKEVNPWFQTTGEMGTGNIKVDREIIFQSPIVGDAEKEDFLEFVNGINSLRGRGGPTVEFDINRFNENPGNYWEFFRGIKQQ